MSGGNMSRITVVIEYEDSDSEPSFYAHMQCLGGTVVAVQFNDALKELENLSDTPTASPDSQG
jgi:hypothetical protein